MKHVLGTRIDVLFMIQDLNIIILIIRIGIVSNGHSLIIRNNTYERSGSNYVTLG